MGCCLPKRRRGGNNQPDTGVITGTPPIHVRSSSPRPSATSSNSNPFQDSTDSKRSDDENSQQKSTVGSLPSRSALKNKEKLNDDGTPKDETKKEESDDVSSLGMSSQGNKSSVSWNPKDKTEKAIESSEAMIERLSNILDPNDHGQTADNIRKEIKNERKKLAKLQKQLENLNANTGDNLLIYVHETDTHYSNSKGKKIKPKKASMPVSVEHINALQQKLSEVKKIKLSPKEQFNKAKKTLGYNIHLLQKQTPELYLNIKEYITNHVIEQNMNIQHALQEQIILYQQATEQLENLTNPITNLKLTIHKVVELEKALSSLKNQYFEKELTHEEEHQIKTFYQETYGQIKTIGKILKNNLQESINSDEDQDKAFRQADDTLEDAILKVKSKTKELTQKEEDTQGKFISEFNMILNESCQRTDDIDEFIKVNFEENDQNQKLEEHKTLTSKGKKILSNLQHKLLLSNTSTDEQQAYHKATQAINNLDIDILKFQFETVFSKMRAKYLANPDSGFLKNIKDIAQENKQASNLPRDEQKEKYQQLTARVLRLIKNEVAMEV